ncbi:MAG: cysteine desulfurase [Burkholderiaceae bacterium]|nr:cysteine desulfurase [Microbacteriaceae bacterium]
MIYLDNAATTGVRRTVLEAMWPYLTEEFGNPSSQHELGQRAASALANARERVSAVLGCRAAEVTFTSGGTESDNLAVKGVALAAPRGRHLVASAIEHEAVLESCAHLRREHGFAVDLAPVTSDALVRAADVAGLLRPDTTLVSVMYANNEVGTVQQVALIAEEAHRVGAVMHTDAVQAAGWLSLDVGALGVDALSVSGHKLGAPKGIGALYLRRGTRVEPVLHGGGQERGRRSGTENVAGAVGLAVALGLAEAARADRAAASTLLRDGFIARVLARVPGARLTGHPLDRLPGNASFCFPGLSGEAVLLELERRGVVCSSGSACAAGRDEPSHVLLALGLDGPTAQTAVRFTLSTETTGVELEAAADALSESVASLGALSTG